MILASATKRGLDEEIRHVHFFDLDRDYRALAFKTDQFRLRIYAPFSSDEKQYGRIGPIGVYL